MKEDVQMADATVATENDLKVAREGIMIQLGSHCKNVADMMETDAGLRAFVENQVQVIAAQRSYIRHLNSFFHPK
jgi:hypothetical protein